MDAQSLARQLSNLLAIPESEIVTTDLLALIDHDIRQAQDEIDTLRKRYDVATEQALVEAIQAGRAAGHPAWEDYIVWKNQRAHIERLEQIVEYRYPDRDK